MLSYASLSLDLDNKWSYLKTHGDARWQDYPSYLELVVPRILDFLELRNLKITFFVVGQDAALAKHHQILRSIAQAGHEIGSHSYKHEPWLQLYSAQEIDEELARAEDAIETATGVRVLGFRGPGFSISPLVLHALKRRGYRYDATAFPNILNPLARAYFFSHSKLTEPEKKQRQALFGTFSDAIRPTKPYQWMLNNQRLTELPVTTMPIFKVPIHFSYLLYLAQFSTSLARAYFKLALNLCRLTHTEPSLLLHPLDFLGCDDEPDLVFFPAMNNHGNEKMKLISECIDLFCGCYQPLTLLEHIKK